jgi:hypothetical protein
MENFFNGCYVNRDRTMKIENCKYIDQIQSIIFESMLLTEINYLIENKFNNEKLLVKAKYPLIIQSILNK